MDMDKHTGILQFIREVYIQSGEWESFVRIQSTIFTVYKQTYMLQQSMQLLQQVTTIPSRPAYCKFQHAHVRTQNLAPWRPQCKWRVRLRLASSYITKYGQEHAVQIVNKQNFGCKHLQEQFVAFSTATGLGKEKTDISEEKDLVGQANLFHISHLLDLRGGKQSLQPSKWVCHSLKGDTCNDS